MEQEIVLSEKSKKEMANPFSSGENFQKIFDIGKMFASSQLVPQIYQGKPMDCTIAVDMANRMGVSPLMVMQNLYVIKGKPSWSGQACMSLIRGSGEYTDVRPVYTGERNTDTWGCYISAVHKASGELVKGTEVTIKMAKDEEWYEKNGSKWKTMPEQMLAYRAAAFFARVYIPNALMGVMVEGEAEDIAAPARMDTDEPLACVDDIMDEAEEHFK